MTNCCHPLLGGACIIIKLNKMHVDFSDNQIEYALRLLKHREQLDDREVREWLDHPENRIVLDQMARMRQELDKRDFSALKANEWNALQHHIHQYKIYVIRRWVSVAAVVVLCLGIVAWFGLQQEENLPLADNIGSETEILPGKQMAYLILTDGHKVELGKENIELDYKGGVRIVNDSVKGLHYTAAIDMEKEPLNEEYNTLKIPVGGFFRLVLADGTKVWLNADSELKYPVQFVGEKREVYLKGEAYFQVSKDSSRQFTVHLQNSEVTVLGTTFNVCAYEDEAHVYTTLEEGCVAFYSCQSKQQVILKPGMQSAMEVATGKTVVSEVDPSLYSAWIEGRFVFQSLDLESILRQLQRWYGFEVFYQQQEVKKYRFRGVLSRDMDIRQALDIIEETTDLKFDIKGKAIMVRK